MKAFKLPQTTIFFSIFFILSCAPSRFVKPLNKKEQAVNLSLGGPLFSYGNATIPMPFVTATYGYGIDSSLTAFTSVNITSALFGNAQVELGITKRLLKQKGAVPGISFNPVANFIYRNKNAAKFYPAVDLNAYWEYNKGRNFFYAGFFNWFELSSHKAFNQKQEHNWLLSPNIGEYFIRKKWNLNIEVKLLAANLESDKTVANYKTPFNHHGAAGIYVGYTRKFR